jgi:hypothetical protein
VGSAGVSQAARRGAGAEPTRAGNHPLDSLANPSRSSIRRLFGGSDAPLPPSWETMRARPRRDFFLGQRLDEGARTSAMSYHADEFCLAVHSQH